MINLILFILQQNREIILNTSVILFFWREHGKRIDWVKPYTKIKDVSFEQDVKIRWFYDGTLNACVNCIDRHLNNRGDQTAIIWEGDNPNESREISYRVIEDNSSL